MRCLVTRPEPDASRFARRLEARGHDALLAPVLEIRMLETRPDLAPYAGLIFTSKNGLRAFLDKGPGFDGPVYTVGGSTADAARKAGLDVQKTGAENARALAQYLMETRPRGPLLHLAGCHQAFDLCGALGEAGLPCDREVLYEARKSANLENHLRDILKESLPDCVFFFSPRTARIFAETLTGAGLAPTCRAMTAIAISPAVEKAVAGLPWGGMMTARRPAEDAMLAALDGLEDTERE